MNAAILLALILGSDPPPNSYPVSGEWHDVDTLKNARVELHYGVSVFEPKGMRAIGFDGWEIGNRNGTTITASERVKGRLALTAIVKLTEGRKIRAIPPPVGHEQRDSFGRLLGEFWVEVSDGQWLSLAKWAADNGHVRR